MKNQQLLPFLRLSYAEIHLNPETQKSEETEKLIAACWMPWKTALQTFVTRFEPLLGEK
jgi:hypothetical protein